MGDRIVGGTFTPVVNATTEEKIYSPKGYRKTRQGKLVNAFTSCVVNKETTDLTTHSDKVLQENLIMENLGCLFEYKKYNENVDKGIILKTSTLQTFLFLNMEYYNQNSPADGRVQSTLDAFMKARNLKNRKEARKELRNSLELLATVTFSHEQGIKDENGKYDVVTFEDVSIYGGYKKLDRKGIITFDFSNKFLEIFKSNSTMNYPMELLGVNNHKYPNKFAIGNKIVQLKHVNGQQANGRENIFAVRTLTAVAPYIPSIEKVREGNRNYNQQIIERFEKTMESFEFIKKWEYCGRNGSELTKEEKSCMYEPDNFMNLNIMVTEWQELPLWIKGEKAEKTFKEMKSKDENQTRPAIAK